MSTSSSPSANANNTNNAWYRFFSILSFSSILLFIVSLLRRKKKLGLVEAHLSPDRGEFAELHTLHSAGRLPHRTACWLSLFFFFKCGSVSKTDLLIRNFFAHAAQFSIFDRDEYGMRICLVSSLVGWARWLVVFSRDERKRYFSVSLTNQRRLTKKRAHFSWLEVV